MTRTAQIYRFMEMNKSLDKLIAQDLEYPIKTAYKLTQAKKELDNAIEYVMNRFGLLCGNDVNFENLTKEQNMVLNGVLFQKIEIEIPEIDIDDIISSDNVKVTPTDIKNISYLFSKNNE